MPAIPPKTLIDPTGHTPIAYKLFHRRQECRGCGNTYVHCEVMAMIPHPVVRTGFIYVPCYTQKDLLFNVPVRVETKALEATPFCHNCWRPGMLSHLPTPRPQPPKVAPSWISGEPKASGPSKTPTSRTKRVYTIDDLEI
jgi:hypothetical protein